METVMQNVPELASLSVFVAVLINVLKQVGVVKEGSSAKLSQYISAVVFALVYLGNQFGVTLNLPLIDNFMAGLADLGLAVLALIPITHKFSGYVHGGLKGIPLVGKAHS